MASHPESHADPLPGLRAQQELALKLTERARARCSGLILLVLVLELTQGKLFS